MSHPIRNGLLTVILALCTGILSACGEIEGEQVDESIDESVAPLDYANEDIQIESSEKSLITSQYIGYYYGYATYYKPSTCASGICRGYQSKTEFVSPIGCYVVYWRDGIYHQPSGSFYVGGYWYSTDVWICY